MTSSDPQPVRGSRRFIWLALGIVAAILLYTAGWFWFAGQVEARSRAALEELRQAGVEITCERLTVRGYPFRVGVFCDGVRYLDARIGAETGPFRSAAQIYQPSRVLAELDGGARLITPGGPVTVNWEVLRASSRLSSPLPALVSLEAREIEARTGDLPLAAASRMEGHFRPREGEIDLAIAFENLFLDPSMLAGTVLPPMSGDADFALEQAPDLVTRGGESLRGLSVRLRRVALRLAGSEAGITASGPVSVDGDGLLDARLQLAVSSPAQLGEVLGQAFPAARREIEGGLAALGALGGATLPVSIDKGRVRAGFLTLGRIPPVD